MIDTDLRPVQPYWLGLPPDPYMPTDERRRRYAVARYRQGKLSVLPDEPHLQPPKYNRLFGGIARNLAPIEPTFFGEPALGEILSQSAACLPLQRCWRLQIHQFRINAPGSPTPEGLHRDGADYVLMVMIRRHEVTGGVTSLYELHNDDPVASVLLKRPGQALLLDDRRVRHYVSEIALRQPGARDAFRDMLVITFHRDSD